MAKRRARKAEEAELLPPEKAVESETGPDGDRLRLPPIIDHDGTHWRDRAAQAWSRAADGFYGGWQKAGSFTGHALSAVIYQSAIAALLAGSIGVAGLALWQAGTQRLAGAPAVPDFEPAFEPDWPTFSWPDIDFFRSDEPGAPPVDMTVNLQAETAVIAPKQTPSDAVRPAEAATAEEAVAGAPPGPAAALPPLRNTTEDPVQATQADRLAEEQVAHDETRKALQAARQALVDRQSGQNINPDLLLRSRQKVALADLLLRLQAGLPFADVLEAGLLENVLTPDEWRTLALYAENGAPTDAVLQTQADALTELRRQGAVAQPMPPVLQWLQQNASNLVTIRQAPLHGAPPELERLDRLMQRGDFAAAAAAIRLALMRLETEAETNPPSPSTEALMRGLHALYADLQAHDELRPLVAGLQADHAAGVRP